MPGPSWNKHHRDAYARLAAQVGDQVDLTIRILWTAEARLTRRGHAPFRRAELSRILGTVDPLTGELSPAHRNSIAKAIRKGITLGLFGEGSSSECIRIPHYLTTHDAGRDEDCQVCRRHKARTAHPQGALAPRPAA